MNACELIQTVEAQVSDTKGLLAKDERNQLATNCRGMATYGH